MKITRRASVKLLAMASGSVVVDRNFAQKLPLISGKSFVNTRESLKKYRIPNWLGESKFGIWSHWGPQSAIGDGDWYARNMYLEGSPQYLYHLKRFGPQSKVGYKDLVPLFTAENWDPDALMDLPLRTASYMSLCRDGREFSAPLSLLDDRVSKDLKKLAALRC